jgi:hypothetical protein
MGHCRPQASFTDSFEEIFPSRMVFITKLSPQLSTSPVPFFRVNSVQRFGVKGKLASRYIGHYEVTEKFGTVAYHIQLRDRLSAVHDVFQVSQLKKCEQIPEAQIMEDTNAEIEPDLSLAEYPMRILDKQKKAN